MHRLAISSDDEIQLTNGLLLAKNLQIPPEQRHAGRQLDPVPNQGFEIRPKSPILLTRKGLLQHPGVVVQPLQGTRHPHLLLLEPRRITELLVIYIDRTTTNSKR